MTRALTKGRFATAVVAMLASAGLLLTGVPGIAQAADTGSIRGVVSDKLGPVPGATVTAYTPSVPRQTTTTAADGSYEFSGLAAADYILCAEATGRTPLCEDGPIPTAHVTAGAVTKLNLTMVRLTTITGTVRLPNGQPANGASVAYWTEMPLLSTDKSDATTDSAGAFSLTVEPGSYYLAAFVPDVYPLTFFATTGGTVDELRATEVDLDQGDSASANITLQPGVRLTGIVTDNGRTPTTNPGLTVSRVDPRTNLANDDFRDQLTPSYDAATHFYRIVLGPGIYQVNLEVGDRYNEYRVRLTGAEAQHTLNLNALALFRNGGGDVTVTGKRRPGSTLTAKSSGWSPRPKRLTYQWLRNDEPIPGATKRTYKVRNSDRGARLAIDVTGHAPGRCPTTSNVEVRIPLGKMTPGKPKLVGTPHVGQPLTVKTGKWAPTKLTFTYQWYRGSSAIKGATAATYKPTPTDQGKQLRVRVTAHRHGYKTTGVYTAKTPPIG